MEKTVFDISYPSISQDQSLALQSEILDFVRSAILVDKGFQVLEVVDMDTFEFCNYYSDGSKIDARPDETRDETIDRIIYTIDCANLRKIKDRPGALKEVMGSLYAYIAGALAAAEMEKNYGVYDKTLIFRVVT